MTTHLHLHDTLTRAKRLFVPMDPLHVRAYVCGPTVYDLAHLGNARSAVVFDQLRRVLLHLYPRVDFVRNVTDIDDKIIARSMETGEAIGDLTARTHAAYLRDTGALGVLAPTAEPRATAYVPQMQDMIGRLIERGHAYTADGHVLFDVSTNPHAGCLSGHATDALLAGASGRVEPAPYKRDQADFVLWKPSLGEQPGWMSPWGFGRPGWHIECSAMAAEHLGPVFDIHGGGQDLAFPHHEAEIAQSTGAHGTSEMARYWVHNGMLTVDGQKMSKSAGNFVTVRDLLDAFPGRGEAIRLLLLSSHYRQTLDFTRGRVEEAVRTLDRFYGALSGFPSGVDEDGTNVDPRVLEPLLDDLNTPQAIAGLHALTTDLLAASGSVKERMAMTLRASARLMGLLAQESNEWFRAGASERDRERIEQMIRERTSARAAKDFRLADHIRRDLEGQGIILLDGPDGTSWRRSS